MNKKKIDKKIPHVNKISLIIFVPSFGTRLAKTNINEQYDAEGVRARERE